jgi:hypothetical protein
MGLIGREMFAIDGVKLPSNASKAKSGTRADFLRQADKMEAAAKAMLARHRENDALPFEPDLAEKDARQIERLTREAAQMRQWLSANPDERRGAKGKVIKSNRTDPDSAKMATSKGVIQGYTGVAAVDAKHQIIVEAQAHGTGSEQALLMPMVKAAAPLCTPDTLITADAGYHSDANLKALAEQDRPALIADNQMRKRDERFKDQAKYKAQPDPLYDKAHPKKGAGSLPAQGLRLRPGRGHLPVSGRQDALPEWIELQSQRPSGGEVPGSATGLRALHAARQMPEETGDNKDPAGQLLLWQGGRRHGELQRAHEAGDRFGTRTSPVWRTLRHGGTGVRQHPLQQGAGSLHVARTEEGGYAVEALLSGAQHREAGASRVCTVGRTWQEDPVPA